MASLFGRILRTLTFFVALSALILPMPGQAAPFAAIIMDARSGETLWEQNADAKLHPASLTKMMTLYIAFQEMEAGRLSLDTMVTVSKHAAAQPPSRLGLKPGQRIAMRHLIRAAAIKSANDAATAIGEHIAGGSEARFAQRMTRTARALGMRNTTFKNANGLTAQGHLSSARDMNLLGRHLFYDFPQYYNIFSRRTADAGIAKVVNTNSRFLDSYEGADGIKTGYTVAAGFNLTASAQRGDKRLITTVFGGTSTAQRNAKMAELMNRGFDLAKNRVKVRPPKAAPVEAPGMDTGRIAEAPAGIDTPDAPGAAAKTIRVSGAVLRSPRPKPRPEGLGQPPVEVPDAVALAIAEGVQSALAEATAPPPPSDSLEGQALALMENTEEPEGEMPELASSAPPARPEQLAEQPTEQAVAEAPAAPAPPAGTLEAQAMALAAGEAPAEAPVALASAEPAAEAPPMAVSSIRPMPRPAHLTAQAETAPATELAEVAPEAAAPVLETVAPAMSEEPVALAMAEPVEEVLAPVLEAVETVAAAAVAPAEAAEAPARRAPIFAPVKLASANETGTGAELAAVEPVAAEEELVVVSKSTSGGRAWAVNVGAFTSRAEAERALLRTGLSESATLDQSLRKVSQSGGKYRASFVGLGQEQADLACRRIRARGVACEAVGPG